MVDEIEFDHYIVLRLPSGEEGAKLSQQEISKAYKLQALELHPDKRPNDPNAHTNFLKLKESYDVLSDETKRRLFDNALRAKQKREANHYDCHSRTTIFEPLWTNHDRQRRTTMFDLRRREKKARRELRKAREPKITAEYKREAREKNRKIREERNVKELEEERAKIRNEILATERTWLSEKVKAAKEDGTVSTKKSKILKATWEKNNGGEEYNAATLEKLFSRFGEVEDVVIRSKEKKGSALVAMGSTDAAITASKSVFDDLSNPLQVVSVESKYINILLSGPGYYAYKDSALLMIRHKNMSAPTF